MGNVFAHTALLEGIIEASDAAVIAEDLEGSIVLWNHGAEGMFGYTAAAAIGQRAVIITPPAKNDEAQRLRDEALRGTRSQQDITVRIAQDGSAREVSLRVLPVRDADGAVIGLVHVLRDVSERKQLELQALHLAALVQSSDDAIASKDLDGVVRSWNPAAERMFGYTPSEMVGQSIRVIIPSDRWSEEDDVLRRVREGQRVEHFDTVRCRKDGTLVPISLTVSPVRNTRGVIIGASSIARDITLQSTLERDRNRLGAIVDSSDDAIVSKDLNGVIQTWNRAAERMFGYSASEAVGQSITLIIPDDRLAEEGEVLRRIRSGKRIDHFETVRRRKDGTAIPISLTVSPVHDHAGRIVGASKVARDLSALRTYATTLEETVRRERDARERETAALRTAEEALRLKDEFLATLSHELRTPLTAISGWLQILELHRDAGRLERGLDAIQRNTTLLTRLIGDLVDVSRIVTGALTLEVQPTDMGRVVDAALDSVRQEVQIKQLEVVITTAPDLDPIAADPDRLQQVIRNLLSNAVKFTPPGGRISIAARREGAMVELSVADTGSGIRPEFLPHVFDRFSQQDGGKTRQHGGMGLGLAIVRHLVDMHGGTVSVSSVEGEGTTFTVRLPSAVSGVRPESSTPPVPKHQLVGVHVLVVDDDLDAREVMARILEDQGATVATAASAAEAYELLLRARPQVLVCDIGMAHEDGMSFMRRLRRDANRSIAHVPAVAVTAFARDFDRQQSMHAGFQSHVAKPFDAAELVAIVRHLARSNNSNSTHDHEPVR
jgi:PAS domain S-box-containing protein